MAEPETLVSLQTVHNRDVILELTARRAGKERKEALVRLLQPPGGDDCTLYSDEGTYAGGENSAPNPLAYFSASIAF